MSDQDVVASLQALEGILAVEGLPDGEALARWRDTFEAAVASAERGAGWEGVVTRAHGLEARIKQLAGAMTERRDDLRRELALQAAGHRAFKGYASGLE